MSRDSHPSTVAMDLEASLLWVRADMFPTLLSGIGIVLWLYALSYLGRVHEFWPGWGLALLLLVVTGGCFVLKHHRYRPAAFTFTAALLVGTSVYLFQAVDPAVAPFMFVPAVLVAGALQGSRSPFIAAAIASTAIIAAGPLVGVQIPGDAYLGGLIVIWLTALTSWATTRSLYTALHWSWTNSEQSERNLAEARSYQGQLAATLRQLEDANYRLERANHALALARTEAEQARQLKAQFAAHVSHELRTPINLIVGFAELMLGDAERYDGLPLPLHYLADLTAIHRSARHLRKLIDDILDLSQIDADEMPVIRDLTNLAAVIQESVETARSLLDRKALSITVDIANGLPMLSLDPLRIQQVLLNLLNNAARFTEHGGIQVRAFQDDRHVIVEVTDTGMGIKPEDLGRLFEPFHQLDASITRSQGGTGLGLAISKRIVELHGGHIWVRSEGRPGKGSTFGFALPTHLDETPTPGTPSRVLVGRYQPVGPAPLPIAIVLDDDPAVVNLFTRYLKGYHVQGAADQNTAVDLAVKRRAKAIITALPNEGDLGAWHRDWSSLTSQIGVRVLGCPMPSGRRVARSLGLADYLVKPVTQDAVIEAVRAAAPAAATILVIDDEPQMVRLLCRMLASAPERFRLLRAYDGQRALSLMAETSPDLVLLDLLMPQVDGLTVVERMKADHRLACIPIVAVSAKGAVEAISPSNSRSLMLISDQILPVGRLLDLVASTLNSMPSAEPPILSPTVNGRSGQEQRGRYPG